VNRAKLYYLRGRVGKKSRIRELRQETGGNPWFPHEPPPLSQRICRAVDGLPAGKAGLRPHGDLPSPTGVVDAPLSL
jgi:hypothetical protein